VQALFVYLSWVERNIYIMEKYTEKKLKNQLLQTLVRKHVSEKTLERVKECNTFLFMVGDQTMEKTKLHRSNNCENRFVQCVLGKKRERMR